MGAGIHEFVPEGVMASIMGKGSWWSVPLSVVIGVPMYSNAAGTIPVVEALLGKGAALGTVLAFMIIVFFMDRKVQFCLNVQGISIGKYQQLVGRSL